MRWLSRAPLWTLTRKSKGSKETETTAFAVMPSAASPRPVVTTVTPVGKRLIAARKAEASASRVCQPCFFGSCSLSADNAISSTGRVRASGGYYARGSSTRRSLTCSSSGHQRSTVSRSEPYQRFLRKL